MQRFARVFVASALGLVPACGGPTVEVLDAGTDAAPAIDASVVACTVDRECDDGVFCNGAETCSANHCVARMLACDDGIGCTADTCNEAMHTCVSRAPDADGDGIADAACVGADGVPLGTDCDDHDPDTFPGNAEVCDAHDEDCNPSTLGGSDADLDGAIPTSCCNPTPGGAACGRDCDDTNASISQLATEICDTIDNDCDGATDEHVRLESWPDADGDGFGDAGTAPDPVCLVPSSRANQGGDCDDDDRRVHPFQTEECNGVDDDCDTTIDESTASACNGIVGTFGECVAGHCVVTSCDATHYDCNGLDADGCEAALCTSAATCGSCRRSCDPGFTVCISGNCPGVTLEIGLASTLRDVMGNPVAGATITSLDVCPVVTATTLADGTYVLESTALPGMVRIEAPGYPTHVLPSDADGFGPLLPQSLIDAWAADVDAASHPRDDRAILVIDYDFTITTVIHDGILGASNAAFGPDLLGFSGPGQRQVFFEAVPGRVNLGGFSSDGAGCSTSCSPVQPILLEAGAVTYVGPFSCTGVCS